MYTNPQHRSDPQVHELRREAGLWLRELRERRGLSQRQLASHLGAEYYTFISQLETGRGRIPPIGIGNGQRLSASNRQNS